jgi:hypothetical protein
MSAYIVAVLTPVLARPHRVEPLIASLRAAATITPCRLVFIATEGDDEEIAAILPHTGQHGDVWLLTVSPEQEGWGRKINFGMRFTTEPFVFTGADDLDFHPGCFERMLAAHLETRACVIGTNDEANPRVQSGHHSTHMLVCREYGECGTVDAPDSGNIMCEAYDHSFVDDEFVATARARGTYAHAKDAVVAHSHPNWGTAPTDGTYQKGQRRFAEDQRLFQSRRYLWEQRLA